MSTPSNPGTLGFTGDHSVEPQNYTHSAEFKNLRVAGAFSFVTSTGAVPPTYANDTAAAAAGIPLGGGYVRVGGTFAIRLV